MQKKISYILGLAAVVMTVAALWFTSRAVTPKQATLGDVLSEAKAGGYKIISTKELADRRQRAPSGILIVDTRQEWEFRAGHIQGAKNFPMEPTWWARWRKAGALGAFLGPDKGRGIVFY